MIELLNLLKKITVPIVVKADGLAAGKGVSICKSRKRGFKKYKRNFRRKI